MVGISCHLTLGSIVITTRWKREEMTWERMPKRRCKKKSRFHKHQQKRGPHLLPLL
ncbi:hypothetical protein NC652_021089 [Populus alba x Populus x berolinensis]|nr:hypothetical protein NC652_021089 [Populus alba x Populus x berolinensis]